jgi:hypothetical protein
MMDDKSPPTKAEVDAAVKKGTLVRFVGCMLDLA